MTLEAWLHEAIGSFPAGVQRRLRHEYLAHLEESVAAGSTGDPVALFGKPKKVQRQLGKVYVTSGRLFNINHLGEKMLWISSCIYLLLIFMLLRFSINSYDYVLAPITFSSWLALVLLTRRWQTIRRQAFRTMMSQAIYFVHITLIFIEGGSIKTALALFMIVSILAAVWDAFRQDARLRRTLDLEQVAP